MVFIPLFLDGNSPQTAPSPPRGEGILLSSPLRGDD